MDSPDEIQQEAHIRIVSKNLYGDGRQPAAYGVLDRQMVVIIIHKKISWNEREWPIWFDHCRASVKKMHYVLHVIKVWMNALDILDI